uniref:Uncharacterized protein n=1 Tax=Mola mola TaxID=94237 RepID=A0A3Q3X6Z6_MOLML
TRMADMPVADKLCNASAKGNLPEVLSLLRNGTDVNGFNKYNTTALQVAKLGNPALICELLLAGADPNLRDPACGLTVTHDAAREGFADSVRVLVEHGADVNIVDGHGNLPLHLAAREGHLEAMRLLLEHPRGRGPVWSLRITFSPQPISLKAKVAPPQRVELPQAARCLWQFRFHLPIDRSIGC